MSPYTPHVWIDNSVTTPAGPLNAARLTEMENALASAYHFYNAKDSAYGAVGDGVTNDTAALTAWVAALNAAGPGAVGVLPPGQYMTTTGFTITAAGVKIQGAGWAQTSFTKGSVITAAAGYSSTAMFTLAGEGCELTGLTIDGSGRATPDLVDISAANCRLLDMSCHGVQAGASSVCVNILSGGVSAWIDNCRINGINLANTGIQVNDTDCIITNTKPTNNTYNIVLLGGASGSQIQNNHMTPGATGTSCIFINGNPSHVMIDQNRFDNYVAAAIQITPPASTPNSIQITNNHFHSTVQTDNTYAAIAVDTSTSGVRALHIVGNTVYGSATSRPKNFLSAALANGSTATNVTRLASLGTLCSGNTAWAATAFQGFGAPTVARGNMTATDGQTYTAVTDI